MYTTFEQMVLNKFAGFGSDMVEVKSDISVLKSDMVEVKSDISVLKRDMVEVKSDISVLKRDMIEVKSDVCELKSDVSMLKTAVEVNREQIAVNTQKLDAHKVHLNNIDVTLFNIQLILKDHDNQFAELKSGQREIMTMLDGLLGEFRRQDTEIVALGSARARHEGRIERLEAHTGLVA